MCWLFKDTGECGLLGVEAGAALAPSLVGNGREATAPTMLVMEMSAPLPRDRGRGALAAAGVGGCGGSVGGSGDEMSRELLSRVTVVACLDVVAVGEGDAGVRP